MGMKAAKRAFSSPYLVLLYGSLNPDAVFYEIIRLSFAGKIYLISQHAADKLFAGGIHEPAFYYNILKLALGGVYFVPFYFK